MTKQKLNFFFESEKKPITTIGVDEAGRGPLAGPVVAASVNFDKNIEIGINDSKKLTPAKREKIAPIIREKFNFGIGIVNSDEIDEINILQATFKAMISALNSNPDVSKSFILIDGNLKPTQLTQSCETIIKGDQKYLSIAAASIVAKCERDRIMAQLHEEYPQYDWLNNKGYGTKKHIELIKKYGPCKYHRLSFLKNIIK